MAELGGEMAEITRMTAVRDADMTILLRSQTSGLQFSKVGRINSDCFQNESAKTMAEIGGEMAEIGGEMAEITGMTVFGVDHMSFLLHAECENNGGNWRRNGGNRRRNGGNNRNDCLRR